MIRKSFLALSTLLALALVLAIAVTNAPASQNSNNSGDDVTCTNSSGTVVPVTTVCTDVVNASPAAFCGAFVAVENEARAQAICGDALAMCGDAGALAFNIAVTKQTCKNSTDVSQSTALDCADTANNCSPALSCPPAPECPAVIVQDRVEQCNHVKVLRNGFIRKRGCRSFLAAESALTE